VRVRGPEPKLLVHRAYSVSRPIPAATPKALAAGWSEALSEILTALEADVRAAEPG